jgi:hypothetical protein
MVEGQKVMGWRDALTEPFSREQGAGASPASGLLRTPQNSTSITPCRGKPDAIDAVRARRHLRDQTRDLQVRVGTAVASRPDMFGARSASPASRVKAVLVVYASPCGATQAGVAAFARLVEPVRPIGEWG